MSENYFNEILGIGKKNYRKGEYLKALECYDQALIIAQENKLNDEECNILINQAGALYRLTRYKESEDYYYKALKKAIKYDLKKQECEIYNYFITLYEMFNDYNKAKEYMDKGFEIVANLNDNNLKAKLLNSKGLYFHIFGNNDDALRCYEKAMGYYQESNIIRGVGTTINLIAGHYYKINDFDQSLNYYLKAKKIGKDLPDFEMMALAICRTGLIYYMQNNKEKSLELLSELQFLEEKCENRKINVEVHHVKGLIYKVLNKKDKAIANFEKAIRLANSIDLKYLIVRIYKDMGIFYLENGDTKTAYNYLKSSIDVFNLIREKIEDQIDRKKYEDSFQDIFDLIWGLSNIVKNIENDEDISEINYIESIVLTFCKLTNNNSNDYVLKLHTRIMTKSILKKFENLKTKKGQLEVSNINLDEERTKELNKNVKLREKINVLKKKIKKFEKKFEEIKNNPQTYKGLDDEYLKDFINTEVWSDSKEQLVKNYFLNDFNNLAEKSKKDLIFMKVIVNIMKTGYEICAFLLAKVVERELKRIIFKTFKTTWRSDLNERNFSIILNDKKYFNSNPDLKNKILRTNEIFLNYLKDKHSLVLGNISMILKQLNLYCRFGNNKYIILGWEKYFLSAFKTNICHSIKKILNGLYSEIHSKKDSIQFINLRNLVSHADDVEPEIINHKEIEFDESFITNLLELMTIKSPRLLIEICKIKPNL